jgi:hypothetical protein
MDISMDELLRILDETDQSEGNSLSGGSRGNWFAGVTEILASEYGIADLDFLYPTWREEMEHYALILDRGRIELVVLALNSLYTRIESNPAPVTQTPGSEGLSEQEVLEYLREAKPSLDPLQDDGEWWNYYFAFLVSLRAFCERALRENKFILYHQWFS